MLDKRLRVASSSLLLLVGGMISLALISYDPWPDSEPIPVLNYAAADAVSQEPSAAPTYESVISLFPRQKTIAPDPAPTIAAQRVRPKAEHTLRYLGTVSGPDGNDLYYIKDEAKGRLVCVGKGVSDGGIEFIQASSESITVRIDGDVATIER